MASSKQNTVEKVLSIIAPIAKQQQLKLWDVRYLKEGASYFLRIFIDKPEGITIDDCERFSRAIDEPLDAADPIKEAYFLEVSSPGLGRELVKPEHFKAYLGEEVVVKLYKAKNNQKEFCGKLIDYENDKIVIEYNDEPLEFLKSEISKVNLNDFDINLKEI
ncbi:MAG: ribosome maturation factor RimP [Acutalibacteraceae bacterium]|nr:ribosome maturation factor RimP [Acutalibacteraceae bacterium]